MQDITCHVIRNTWNGETMYEYVALLRLHVALLCFNLRPNTYIYAENSYVFIHSFAIPCNVLHEKQTSLEKTSITQINRQNIALLLT